MITLSSSVNSMLPINSVNISGYGVKTGRYWWMADSDSFYLVSNTSLNISQNSEAAEC